jgi:hypothetical protein
VGVGVALGVGVGVISAAVTTLRWVAVHIASPPSPFTEPLH